MFIQTEPTPNPNVLKFLPGRDVSPAATLEYRTIDEATASPWPKPCSSWRAWTASSSAPTMCL